VLVLIAIMGAVVLASPARSRFPSPTSEEERRQARQVAAGGESMPQAATVTSRRSS
jgi:hypothetical protein